MSLCGGPAHPQPAVSAWEGAGPASRGGGWSVVCVCVCPQRRVRLRVARSGVVPGGVPRSVRRTPGGGAGPRVPLPSPSLFGRPGEMPGVRVALAVTGAVVRVVKLMPGRLF